METPATERGFSRPGKDPFSPSYRASWELQGLNLSVHKFPTVLTLKPCSLCAFLLPLFRSLA